jgi:hypothetical protein
MALSLFFLYIRIMELSISSLKEVSARNVAFFLTPFHCYKICFLAALISLVAFIPIAQAHDGSAHPPGGQNKIQKDTNPLLDDFVPSSSPSPQGNHSQRERELAGRPGGEFKFVPGVGPARQSLDGSQLEVATNTGIVTTHGSDIKEEGVKGSSTDFDYPSMSLYNPSCYSGGGQFRLVYMHASTVSDRWSSDMTSYMRTGFKKANSFVRKQSIDNGDPSVALRAKCHDSGTLEVLNYGASSQTVSGATLAGVTDEIRARWNNNKYKYIVLFDTGSGCKPFSPGSSRCATGIATGYIDDDTRSTSNSANQPNSTSSSGIGVVWSKPYFSEKGLTTLHETLHGMGAVNNAAPQATGKGHCWDDYDVMCYDDGGTKSPGAMYVRCSSGVRIDCGRDSYFKYGATSGWLSSNWQVGYPGNRFMSFTPDDTTN